ncbi:hypothetical protein XTALMG727_3913 [Xanthomonas translucens pv. arrhenatheri LMG 727]|uniref:Uncharacterized protein n=1 Tax=Xanthomonas graminis pv. arrhenatheri LMG 727 TaxID=1195923 RepID=A0A0K3A6D4_9XANT|nr:hypothetical protein XTALMG727_3913 [Xanthomonas translucens pv. arrhenatheri LMG 727]
MTYESNSMDIARRGCQLNKISENLSFGSAY